MHTECSVREIEYVVMPKDGEITARHIMAHTLGLSSREITRCKQFEDGVRVLRNGALRPETLMIRDSLTPGDKLIVRIYEDNERAFDVIPWDRPIDIVYEDEDLILINKPGDMVVHPSYAHYTDSLSNALSGYYLRTGQRHMIRAIGRLDRETSGLVMFAKNRYSASLLSDQKGLMSRRKEYLAIAEGIFEDLSGTVNAPIERRDDSKMIREVRPDGKEAITHYEVVKQYEKYALIRLWLDTGRTHQIRVHMSYIGHPLIGDTLYGHCSEEECTIKRAALHAAKLEFRQPVTGRDLKFEAPLPEDMRILVQ